MPFRARTLTREFTAALVVVAVYVLVLLVPLHQAAGLQKDLAELGFASPSTWSICAAANPGTGDERSATDIKCAVAGIGKHELAAVDFGAIDFDIRRFAVPVIHIGEATSWASSVAPHSAQARAPPVLV